MTTTEWFLDTINQLNDYLWTYVVIVMLIGCAVYFTIRAKGVQFWLLKDMLKVIVNRPIYINKVEKDSKENLSVEDERLKKIGSFQASPSRCQAVWALAILPEWLLPSSSVVPVQCSGCG